MLNPKSGNLNLTLQYLFLSNNSFFKLNLANFKGVSYIINPYLYYYFSLMLKYSSSFYKPSLIELFSYELPSQNFLDNKSTTFFSVKSKPNQYVVLVFFLSNFSSYLYLIFASKEQSFLISTSSSLQPKVDSIENLFFNANWLERESSEMTGLFFSNKLDSRNLLMMYGDSFYPMLKYFTSVGLFELFYNVPNDILIKSNVSLQN